MLPALLLAVATVTTAKQDYIWVKDKRVSSLDILASSLSTRILQLSETRALKTVRSIMSRELHMTLSKYDKKNREQAAQTTTETILPEKIAGRGDRKLADEDYVFMLEVELKEIDGQTRIIAKAQPIYRVRNIEGEDRKNTVEIIVKAEPGQAVALGPMFVMPVSGQLTDYNAQILPDAAKRVANLVRYFMQELDRKIGGEEQPIAGMK